jgi:hypothetical protein
MILWMVGIYLVQSIGGFLLVHLVWDAREARALIFKLALGPGMGAGVSSLLYFSWSWLGLLASIFPFFEVLVLGVLFVAVWRKESRQNWHKIVPAFPAIQKKTVIWMIAISAAVSFCIINLWMKAVTIPHGYYDAWAIWNGAARFIYGRGSTWLHTFSQDAWGHADYPLLVPLNVAEGWLIMGSPLTRVPLVFSVFMMLSLLGLVFSSLFIARDFEQGALTIILLSSLPVLVLLGSFQYADMELSLFFLATGVLFYLYTISLDTRLLVLAGFFAGFSGWTKNEGQIFIVFSLLVCLILSLKNKKNILKYFGAGLFFPAIVILLFKSVAPPNDLFVDKTKSFLQLFDPARHQLILVQIWETVISFGYWPVSFFLVLVLYALLVWKPNRVIKGKPWILLCLCFFQFAGYFVIYLITPYDLRWHLDTSLPRLIFHIMPLMVFWLFNRLPSPPEIFGQKPFAQQPDYLEEG